MQLSKILQVVKQFFIFNIRSSNDCLKINLSHHFSDSVNTYFSPIELRLRRDVSSTVIRAFNFIQQLGRKYAEYDSSPHPGVRTVYRSRYRVAVL